MKNIVIPTDFSENALKAASFALSYAARYQTSLRIFHAYKPFRSGFQPDGPNELDEARTRAEAEQQMKVFLDTLKDAVPAEVNGTTVVTECLKGELIDLLDDLHKQQPIDLLIMGTHGATGLKYKFLGSNTFDVARKTTLPLLIVPLEIDNYHIDNIAFFTDYHSHDRRVLSGLVSLFGIQGIDYNLIHIHEPSEAPKEADSNKLRDWANKLKSEHQGIHLSPELIAGKANADTVNRVAERSGTNLLAFTMINRTVWERLMDKSLARALVLQSHTPVFIRH